MKKAKNENAVKSKTNAAVKEKASVNDPSEKIRSKDEENTALTFKKILYGYDPGEVESYINEISGNYEASARNYEQKLSSIKEELALSNRERDSYGEKYRQCKARLDKQDSPPADNDAAEKIRAEYEKIIDSLNDRLNMAEAEAERLGALSARSDDSVYSEKIAELEEENRELRTKAEAAERKNEEISALKQKYDSLFGDYNLLVSQHECIKSGSEAKEREISELRNELSDRSAEIADVSLENDELKKKLAELEAENGVLAQRAEENEKEILRLKDVNKAQAHEYADKINTLERERSADKLAIQKETKLRDYYVNQAQVTISELSEQMEQIRKTFIDTLKE